MRPYLFLITGFPGTGKLTVARALSRLLEEAGETVRLVDNHWINNTIFGLIEQDGLTPLPSQVWDRVGDVADAVVRTLEELTPRAWQVIMTFYLDGETDIGTVPRLIRVAAARRATFVPVRLLCDPAENARRIVMADRRERMKSLDPDEPRRLAAKGQPYEPGHANTLTLDITSVQPADAARRILDHAFAITGGDPHT